MLRDSRAKATLLLMLTFMAPLGCARPAAPRHVERSTSTASPEARSSTAAEIEAAQDAEDPASPRAPQGARLIVELPVPWIGAHPSTVGWFLDDGSEIGVIYLNPVHGSLRGEAVVPAKPLHLFLAGWDESGRVWEDAVGLTDGSEKLIVPKVVQGKKLHDRRFSVVAKNGVPLRGSRIRVVLDGSHEAARTALLNRDVTVDAHGVAVLRLREGRRPYTVQVLAPLMGSPETFVIGATTRRVQTVSEAVDCAIRCPGGRDADYPSLVAVAELTDGDKRRFEQPESDALSRGNVVFAWPVEVKRLYVATPYSSVTELTSPRQRCVLVSRCAS